MPPVPAPGQLVTVRQRRCVVLDVRRSEVPPDARISARKSLPQAIWLLHEISREAALCAILERIASNRGSGSLDLSDLSAMIHGMRPGQPPAMLLGGCWSDFSVSLREADEDPAYQSTIDDQLPSSLRYAPTLDSLAAGLIQLVREIPANALGLPAAMASMLAGDVTRWTALWERAGLVKPVARRRSRRSGWSWTCAPRIGRDSGSLACGGDCSCRRLPCSSRRSARRSISTSRARRCELDVHWLSA